MPPPPIDSPKPESPLVTDARIGLLRAVAEVKPRILADLRALIVPSDHHRPLCRVLPDAVSMYGPGEQVACYLDTFPPSPDLSGVLSPATLEERTMIRDEATLAWRAAEAADWAQWRAPRPVGGTPQRDPGALKAWASRWHLLPPGHKRAWEHFVLATATATLRRWAAGGPPNEWTFPFPDPLPEQWQRAELLVDINLAAETEKEARDRMHRRLDALVDRLAAKQRRLLQEIGWMSLANRHSADRSDRQHHWAAHRLLGHGWRAILGEDLAMDERNARRAANRVLKRATGTLPQ